jgi:hypothetical protein
VSFARLCSEVNFWFEGLSMRRFIGLDVHREFAEVAIWQEGVVRSGGQIATTPEALRLFAGSLCEQDEVAIEATCNTHAIARLREAHVVRVVVSNPMNTRAIADAKVKTDKVDALVLAELLAADDLPGVWIADDETHALRRQVARRAHIVRQRTRLKNQVQSIVHRNLVPRCPAADRSGTRGRRAEAGRPESRVAEAGGESSRPCPATGRPECFWIASTTFASWPMASLNASSLEPRKARATRTHRSR